MTDLALIERITRSLAFMLRHQPETFDLELDPHGFADLDDVVQALNERLGEPVEEEDVRDAVSAGDRPRYEIQGERIRALYGHSIPVDPGESSKPPEFLYVAVPEQELERARRFGLRGGRRRFLHLAATREDAAESGRRASRDYTVLVVHALDAWEEGISFYDRTALWLAEEVPTHLLEVEGTFHDGTDPLPRRFDGGREGQREGGGRDRERGHGQDRSGRRRGGRGRGRDRQAGSGQGSREYGGGQNRDSGARGPRDAERSPYSAAESGGRTGDRLERTSSRRDEPRRDEPRRGDARRDEPRRDVVRRDEPGRDDPRRAERSPEREYAGADEAARSPERQPRRDDGRDRRPDRPQERTSERRERGREGRDPDSREPAREGRGERTLETSPPDSDGPRGPRGGFGSGLDRHDSGAREERPPSPPRPSAPPPREERAPVEKDRPGFGAGL